MNEEKIILHSSPEAAEIKTVTGWVSRNGRFWGEHEDAARYDGCTHKPCRFCGEAIHKQRAFCDSCRVKREIESYHNRPRKEWDGAAMLFSEWKEEYYNDINDAEEALEDEQTLEDLRLVICEPNYIKPLEPDYFCDELDDDSETPKELLSAIDAFNAAIKNMPPVSWSPGKYALEINKDEA